jgi:hypothetical protein
MLKSHAELVPIVSYQFVLGMRVTPTVSVGLEEGLCPTQVIAVDQHVNVAKLAEGDVAVVFVGQGRALKRKKWNISLLERARDASQCLNRKQIFLLDSPTGVGHRPNHRIRHSLTRVAREVVVYHPQHAVERGPLSNPLPVHTGGSELN